MCDILFDYILYFMVNFEIISLVALRVLGLIDGALWLETSTILMQ